MAFRLANSKAPIDKLFEEGTGPGQTSAQADPEKTSYTRAEMDSMSKEDRTKVLKRNWAALQGLIGRRGKVITK